MEDPPGVGQGDPVGDVLVEQVPEIGRDVVAWPVDQRPGPRAEMRSDP
jgi:hypothetical protein